MARGTRLLAALLLAVLAAPAASLQVPFWAERSRARRLLEAGYRSDVEYSPYYRLAADFFGVLRFVQVRPCLLACAASRQHHLAAVTYRRMYAGLCVQDGFGAYLDERRRLAAMQSIAANCTRHSLDVQRSLELYLEGARTGALAAACRLRIGARHTHHAPKGCAAGGMPEPNTSISAAPPPLARRSPRGGLQGSSGGWHCRAAGSDRPVWGG